MNYKNRGVRFSGTYSKENYRRFKIFKEKTGNNISDVIELVGMHLPELYSQYKIEQYHDLERDLMHYQKILKILNREVKKLNNKIMETSLKMNQIDFESQKLYLGSENLQVSEETDAQLKLDFNDLEQNLNRKFDDLKQDFKELDDNTEDISDVEVHKNSDNSDDLKEEEDKIKYIIRILSFYIEKELDEYSDESYDIEALTKEQCEIWDVNFEGVMYVMNFILDGSLEIDDVLTSSFENIELEDSN